MTFKRPESFLASAGFADLRGRCCGSVGGAAEGGGCGSVGRRAGDETCRPSVWVESGGLVILVARSSFCKDWLRLRPPRP